MCVRRSANWCPADTCFATTIFSSSFLRTIWQSTSMCLIFSWNMTFSTCIAALLSPYSLMGHSGKKQSLSINLWSRLALMHICHCHVLRLCAGPRDHTLYFCFSMIQGFLQERHNIMWSTSYQKSTITSMHLRSMLLWCVYDLNREALSLELSSGTSKSPYRIQVGSLQCWQKLIHHIDYKCDVQSGSRQVVQFLHQSLVSPNILKELSLSLVITISSTYTTSKILFPSCIRQNTE